MPLLLLESLDIAPLQLRDDCALVWGRILQLGLGPGRGAAVALTAAAVRPSDGFGTHISITKTLGKNIWLLTDRGLADAASISIVVVDERWFLGHIGLGTSQDRVVAYADTRFPDGCCPSTSTNWTFPAKGCRRLNFLGGLVTSQGLEAVVA